MTTTITETTTTRERPILFSGPMVRAILEGKKTQTRRVVKLPERADPDYCSAEWEQTKRCEWMEGPHHTAFIDMMHPTGPFMVCRCPYGQIGDRLWVRETWAEWDGDVFYRATYDPETQDKSDAKWRPSIFMPRGICRIVLEIANVRVERIKEITGHDVAAEGFPFSSDLDQFKLTWDKLNAKRGYSWESNPWVWVVEFRRIEP